MSSTAANLISSIDTLDQIYLIKDACAWAGISKGRVNRYAELLRELLQENKRSQEHLKAWHESSDITEMHQLWGKKTDLFPRFKSKIRTALKDGPLLSVEENASSTNRARNDSFNYLLAGRLLGAGLDVLAVDGCAREFEETQWMGDITLRHRGAVLDIQCKRPWSQNSLIDNIKRAKSQVITVANPARGIIAIDLSRCISLNDAYASSDEASESLHAKVVQLLSPEVHRLLGQAPQIVGLIAFASIPAEVVYLSSVLSSDGTPYTSRYLHSVGHTRLLINEQSPHSDILKSLYGNLEMWYRSHMKTLKTSGDM